MNQVFCCLEIYHNNVNCEAQLLQDPEGEFTMCSNHSHPPQDKMVKYIEKNNVFRDEKGTTKPKRKRGRKESSAEPLYDGY